MKADISPGGSLGNPAVVRVAPPDVFHQIDITKLKQLLRTPGKSPGQILLKTKA